LPGFVESAEISLPDASYVPPVEAKNWAEAWAIPLERDHALGNAVKKENKRDAAEEPVPPVAPLPPLPETPRPQEEEPKVKKSDRAADIDPEAPIPLTREKAREDQEASEAEATERYYQPGADRVGDVEPLSRSAAQEDMMAANRGEESPDRANPEKSIAEEANERLAEIAEKLRVDQEDKKEANPVEAPEEVAPTEKTEEALKEKIEKIDFTEVDELTPARRENLYNRLVTIHNLETAREKKEFFKRYIVEDVDTFGNAGYHLGKIKIAGKAISYTSLDARKFDIYITQIIKHLQRPKRSNNG
jgi:hypothetical protein